MKLCKTPNQHAPKPSVRINENISCVNGYNSYEIKNGILYNKTQSEKFKLIKPYLSNLKNKTVVDLGCANGLYSIHSALNNANVYAVDIDNTHLSIVDKVSKKHNLNIKTLLQNVEEFNTKVNITIALALIHWIYSCTSIKYGSLDKIIEWLSSITTEYLIIEWIDAKHDAVNWFKHTEYNSEYIKETYTKEKFDLALTTYFQNVKYIGETTKYRKLYIAYK